MGQAAKVRLAALPSVIALAAALLPAAVSARTMPPEATCHTLTKPQVAALFDRWNHALGTRKTDDVVATYAPDATLLPTVENGPLTGSAAIGKYFTYFLKQAPQATVQTRAIHTGCNVAYDIGLYNFMVDGDQPGTRVQVKARYTFIYEPVHGKWMIVHHHSSALPVP